MLWKKEFLDALAEKFPGLVSNLTVSLTSIGFTNNFEKVEPKVKPTTSINIFKKESECYTDTPCDKDNQRVTGTSTFIKCQCLKPEDTDDFADSFKEALVS